MSMSSRPQLSESDYYNIYQPVKLSDPLKGITGKEREALDAQRERVRNQVLSDHHSIVRPLFEDGGPRITWDDQKNQ